MERRRKLSWSRLEFARSAAAELLYVLADVHSALVHLPLSSGRTFGAASPDDASREALDELSHAQLGVLPRVGNADIARRRGSLRAIVGELAHAHAIPAGAAGEPTDWTENKIGRAKADVQEYLSYVRRSFEAIIAGQALPPYEEPPFLRRADNVPWSPAGR